MNEEKKYPIRPIFNRVLLKREQAFTKSTIIVPEGAAKSNAPSIGIVLDLGSTCDDPVKELLGKKVMFSRFAGDWIKIPNVEEEYFLCSDEDILGEILV
jgi:co-chaperonin GroES (HSP10)